MKISIICDSCKIEFEKKLTDIKRTKNNFCSVKCFHSFKNIIKEPTQCLVCLRINKTNTCSYCKENESSKKYYQKNKEKILLNASLRYDENRKITNRPKKKPNGSGYISPYGYKWITKVGHPNCITKQGRICEHTYIMSNHLGRPLKKGENVHHINGIRDDNRIENLELWSTSQPAGQRVEDKIKWCKEFLKQYEK